MSVNRAALTTFFESKNVQTNWLIANNTSSDTIAFANELPPLDKIKKKMILVMKCNDEPFGSADEVRQVADGYKDLLVMEFNRQILENLYTLCQVCFLSAKD